jgi:hypothetical protein
MPADHGIEVVTFGCRLNTFESEVMRRHAEAASLANLVIVHGRPCGRQHREAAARDLAEPR